MFYAGMFANQPTDQKGSLFLSTVILQKLLTPIKKCIKICINNGTYGGLNENRRTHEARAVWQRDITKQQKRIFFGNRSGEGWQQVTRRKRIEPNKFQRLV